MLLFVAFCRCALPQQPSSSADLEASGLKVFVDLGHIMHDALPVWAVCVHDLTEFLWGGGGGKEGDCVRKRGKEEMYAENAKHICYSRQLQQHSQ